MQPGGWYTCVGDLSLILSGVYNCLFLFLYFPNMGKPQKHNKTVRNVIFINFLKLNSQCEMVKKI